MKVYIIGSLRNPKIPELGILLREHGIEVFDDWFAGSPIADDSWQEYEQQRGRHYSEALYGEAATNIYQFDKRHLDESDAGVIVMPAGKSGHIEGGYLAGQGKRVYVLFDGEPERWDVMYRLLTHVYFDTDSLIDALIAPDPALQHRFCAQDWHRCDGGGKGEYERYVAPVGTNGGSDNMVIPQHLINGVRGFFNGT